MVVEVVSIIGFAGLASAWAIWGYPRMKGEEADPADYTSMRMMLFTQGQCGECLLPNARDQKKMASHHQQQKVTKETKEN